MSRIIFFLILALVVWVVIGAYQRRHLRPQSKSSATPGKASEAQVLPCLHCGAYAPVSEGVLIQGRYYCSKEHAQIRGESL
jgi:uncharacterized protein